MEFAAQVLDAKGKKAVIVEAPSIGDARTRLREMGYLAILWIM